MGLAKSNISDVLSDKWPYPFPEPSGNHHSFFPSLHDIFNFHAKIPETVCCSFPCCIPKQEVACLLAGVGWLTERNKQKAVMTQFARMFYPLCAMEGGSSVRSSLWRVPKAEQWEEAPVSIGIWWMLAWENPCRVNYLKDHLVQKWWSSWQLPSISSGVLITIGKLLGPGWRGSWLVVSAWDRKGKCTCILSWPYLS